MHLWLSSLYQNRKCSPPIWWPLPSCPTEPLSWLLPWLAKRALAEHLYKPWAARAPLESPAAWQGWWRRDAKDDGRPGRTVWRERRAKTTLRTRTCSPSTSARTKGPRWRAAGERESESEREKWSNNRREVGKVTVQIMVQVTGYMWADGEWNCATRDSWGEGGGVSEGGLGQRDESVIHLWNEVLSSCNGSGVCQKRHKHGTVWTMEPFLVQNTLTKKILRRWSSETRKLSFFRKEEIWDAKLEIRKYLHPVCLSPICMILFYFFCFQHAIVQSVQQLFCFRQCSKTYKEQKFFPATFANRRRLCCKELPHGSSRSTREPADGVAAFLLHATVEQWQTATRDQNFNLTYRQLFIFI